MSESDPTAVIVASIALIGAPIGAAASWFLNRNTRKKETANLSVTAAESAVISLQGALAQAQLDLTAALVRIAQLEKQVGELLRR